jgi:AcrR family transcriptional regulator
VEKDETVHSTSGVRVAKQQRSRETQETIFTAAVNVFAERGYNGASMRLIAETAGVGQPLVVYHFPTKEDLWVSTVEWVLDGFLERFRPSFEALDGLDPATRLRLIFQDFVHYSAETPELLEIMIDANKGGGPNLAKVVEKKLRPTYEFIHGLIEAAQESGAVPPGDPALIYYSLIAVSSMVFSLTREFEIMTGRNPLEPDIVEAQASLLVRLFFPGLRHAG